MTFARFYIATLMLVVAVGGFLGFITQIGER